MGLARVAEPTWSARFTLRAEPTWSAGFTLSAERTWSAGFTLSAERTSDAELAQPVDECIHLLLGVSS